MIVTQKQREKPRVYLGGAVANKDDYGADWRDSLTAEFEKDFEFLNPLHWFQPSPTESADTDVVREDLRQLTDADLLLVNWEVGVPKTGTPMEMVYAHGYGKHIVVWASNCASESEVLSNISPWVAYHSDVLTHDRDEAVSALYDIA